MQQAVVDGADGIILFAITPALIQSGLDTAKQTGIPIVAVFRPRFEGVPEVQGYVTGDHAEGAQAAAGLIAKETPNAKVLVLDVKEYPEVMTRNDTLATHLKQICSGCTVIRQAFAGATAPQRMAGMVSSFCREGSPSNLPSNPPDPSQKTPRRTCASRASMVAFSTGFSKRRCSSRSPRPARSWRAGAPMITPSGRIPRSRHAGRIEQMTGIVGSRSCASKAGPGPEAILEPVGLAPHAIARRRKCAGVPFRGCSTEKQWQVFGVQALSAAQG